MAVEARVIRAPDSVIKESNMAEQITCYRIFIASPSGLEAERQAFRQTILAYNESEALYRGVIFLPMGWELAPGGVGRPQSLINQELRRCDYFVLLLAERWGTPPFAGPHSPYTSGTEEEYNLALDCLHNADYPLRQITIGFRAPDPRLLVDPGEQLKKVLEFKQKLEREKAHLFYTFDATAAFQEILRRDLGRWLRDHEQGSPKSTPLPTELPSVPIYKDSSLKAGRPIESDISTAERLAKQGRHTEAEALFAKSVASVDNAKAIWAYGNFLKTAGRLVQAESMYKRLLELATERNDEFWIARALANLGSVLHYRGRFNEAEQRYEQALVIDEQLAHDESLARDYRNLGHLAHSRGDLVRAEQMFQKALKIYEKAGDEIEVAGAKNALGAIALGRRDLKTAEQMLQSAVVVAQNARDKHKLASIHANLGELYMLRGDLEEGQYHLQLSVTHAEQTLNSDVLAFSANHLGALYYICRDFRAAETMYRRVLSIEQELQNPSTLACSYGNLGIVLFARGESSEAEQTFRRAMEVSQASGNSIGIAYAYVHLALVCQSRGEQKQAKGHWDQARAILSRIEIAPLADDIMRLLDEVEKNSTLTTDRQSSVLAVPESVH